MVTLAVGGYVALRERGWLEGSGASAPPAPEPVDEAPPAPPAPPPDAGLPPLAESDPTVQEKARELSTHPALDGWLHSGSLIRRIVAVIENVADGESPRLHVPFLAPPQPFGARSEGQRTFVDPASYARYDVVGDVIASLDATACARLYAELRPLLETAYGELGRSDRTFDQTLSLAIARLLAVPVPAGPVELTPLVTTYEFADPRLESLSRAEKHLLRMGPRNAGLVQVKLREIEAALTPAPSR